MSMRTVVVFSSVLAPWLCARAASYSVDNSVRVYVRTSDAAAVTVTATTTAQDAAYPDAVGEPAFWLDASVRTGWLFGADGVSVTNVPSRTGTRRLTTDRGSWYGWHGGSTLLEPNGPKLVTEGALDGRPVLDFGTLGSRCALVFDADPDSVTAGTPSNVLRRIGTIIQVRNSENGGGWLMGGGNLGPNDPNGSANYNWHRGSGLADTGYSRYYAPVGRDHMQDPAEYGKLFHHGFVSSPCFLGFDGGWETLSLQCSSSAACATGVGCNDTRTSMSGSSGGFRLAEILIYDRILTVDEITRVELYLERKWFGRSRPGWNGDARVGDVTLAAPDATVAHGTFDVPAGTTLTVGRLRGGRVAGKGADVTKTGAGDLVLHDAAPFAGTVRIAEGALAFPEKRAVPTNLPYNVYLRFDTSAAGSIETATVNGTNFVSCWRDVSGLKYRGQNVVLRPYGGVRAPFVRTGALGAGKDVIDFGENSAAGMRLAFTTNETAAVTDATYVALDCVATVFAVLGAQCGGGNLLNVNPFTRSDSSTTCYDSALFITGNLGCGISPSDAHVWIDGRPHSPRAGYDTPGYQVVALQTPGSGKPNLLGSSVANNYSGGFRLAELIIYTRLLTEREIEDVQAYLSAKWLGRPTPGYAAGAASAAKPDLQTVEVTGDAEIHVAAGQTSVVSRLVVCQPLRKTGSGELWLNELVVTNHGQIVSGAETIHVKAGRDAPGESALAADAALHLDASDAATLDVRNGTLRYWQSADGALADGATAYDAAHRPTVLADAIGGRAVVDFGTYGANGKWLSLDHSLQAIHSVFLIVGYHGKGGFIMGSNSEAPYNDASTYDFHGTGDVSSQGLFYNNVYAYATREEIYTNGVKVAYNENVPTNAYFLLELHMKNAAQASALGHDRNIADRLGGFRIGEIVAYDRILSARERQATRNYLAGKWFGTSPVALPEKSADPADAVPLAQDLVVDGSCERTFDGDADVARLSGAGVFTKSGDGTLTLKNVSAFTGTVCVASGTLALAGADAAVVPKCATDGLIFHADAMRGIAKTTTNATSGVVGLATWDSTLGDGWSAVSWSANGYPLVMNDPDVGGLDTVRMANQQFYRFKKDGQPAVLDNIRTILWMIGSQEGGGWLLGGGTNRADNSKCPWHRGQTYVGEKLVAGTTNTCPYLHNSVSHPEARRARWRCNGVETTYGKGTLSGGWDVLSMVVKSDDDLVNAEGFSYDGRKLGGTLENPTWTNDGNAGMQRLGEVLVYDRRLTDDELYATESYLGCRWSVGMHPAATNATILCAAGASVDLKGHPQQFAAIAGAGTFAGDVGALSFTADASEDALPAVTGTLTVPAGATVTLANLPARLAGVHIPIARANAVQGDLDAVTFAGATCPPPFQPVLRFSNGTLFVRFKGTGMSIIVR